MLEIIRKYIELFEKLLDAEDQGKVALEIEAFSQEVNSMVEDSEKLVEDSEKLVEEINNACLAMHHWKDETGYCSLTEKEIKSFIRQLKELMNIL